MHPIRKKILVKHQHFPAEDLGPYNTCMMEDFCEIVNSFLKEERFITDFCQGLKHVSAFCYVSNGIFQNQHKTTPLILPYTSVRVGKLGFSLTYIFNFVNVFKDLMVKVS